MANQLNGLESKRSYPLESPIEQENETDKVGYWFAIAALFAFVVAGVIVYRTGNSDFTTAPDDLHAATRSAQAPISPQRP